MKMNISIRKATFSDIPVLLDFQLKLALETENLKLDPGTLEKGMRSLFNDPSKGLYYVAEADDEIAGCHMLTYEWSDWRNGMVYWLQSVYVKSEFRKHGIFKKMFNRLMEEIRDNPGIIGLRLYVDKSNERAQKVYAAMGMNGDHYSVFEWIKSNG